MPHSCYGPRVSHGTVSWEVHLAYSWGESTKLLEGRAAVVCVHVGCCVFVLLCFVRDHPFS